MNKKIKYIALITLLMLPNIVLAAGFDVGTTNVCGFSLPKTLPHVTSILYNLIKILVPVILVIMGMVDMLSAMSSDEKGMSKSTKKFITRIIAAVVVFVVMALVQFAFNSSNVSNKSDLNKCMNCLLSDKGCNNSKVEKYIPETKLKECEAYSKDECPSEDGYKMACTVRNNTCVTDCSKIDPNTCRNLPKKCKFDGSCKFLD